MATTALHNYLEETKFTVSTSESNDNPPLRILEAHAGSARSALLERYRDNAARSGARCFLVSCSFDLKGPWGGVNDLFPDLLPEIRLQRPDLIERHSFELVSVLPELRRTLNVRNPNLTDLAEGTERTRNYPADRAYRIAHGLIDLLDGWKTKACPETPWFIACDSFDLSGAMGGFFFRELLRRRGSQLNLRLLIGVASGKGAETVATFDSGLSSDIISVDLPLDPSSDIDPSEAQSEAEAIEERIAGDPVAIRSNLSDLIRCWRAAGNSE
jgi:hypothetical protein